MPADHSVSVKVFGMAEVGRALKQVSDKVAGDGLKAALFGIAGKVAARARGSLPGGSGKAAGSILPHSTTRGASVSFGGQAAPYLPWLDFGGSVGRGHKPGSAWSGAIKREWMGRPVGEGRYVYPAISGEREATLDAVLEAIAQAARHAEFEVRG